ncbi:Hypothetical predicted protein, partial [Paramuricea clavata]
MATKKQALRSSAQNANISSTKSPSKPVQSKILNLKDTMESEDEKESGVKEMFEVIMRKLSKLDDIDSCVKSMENDHPCRARSMRDNLIFYNINEMKDENPTDIVHGILENQLGFENAKDTVKIDRAHRLGRPNPALFTTRPRAIVCKFNFFPDKERILANAKKLKGTRIAISEQFPEEIMQVRKRLYPVLKKARQEHKQVKM